MSAGDTAQYFICGGVGGICTVLVGHPFDTIKVRLQTMPKTVAGERPMYTGMMDCARKIVLQEGISGLYKGMTAPFAAVVPSFAVSFMGYRVGQKLLGPEDPSDLTGWHFFLSGAFSAIFTTVLMAPSERVKCLLQVQQSQTGEKKYSGPMDVLAKLYKEGGLRSVFKGSVATLARDMPASGMYYMTYEMVKKYLTDGGKTNVTFFGTVFAGGCAGVSNWLVAMPQDVLKSRLQTAPEGTFPNGIKDVLRDLLKNEGPLALYRGFIPVIVRSFPANAACFVGFEASKRFLHFVFG